MDPIERVRHASGDVIAERGAVRAIESDLAELEAKKRKLVEERGAHWQTLRIAEGKLRSAIAAAVYELNGDG